MARHKTGRDLDPAAFPVGGDFADQALDLIGYATLAPSGHNTQPWQFRIGADSIDLRADRRRALPVVDPADRALIISCGAALATLEIAARAFGLVARSTLLPDPRDPDLLARVTIAPGGEVGFRTDRLFQAIQARRTTRAAFLADPVVADVLTRGEAHAAKLGVRFTTFAGDARKDAIADLVAQGDRDQFADPEFRRELAAWVRSAAMGAHDGMSGAQFGMPDVLSSVGGLVIRTFDMGDGIAASDRTKIVEATPVLAILSTGADTPTDWINTGRSLARTLLELTADGLTSSYLNQPIEVPGLRPRLSAVAGLDGVAQILLRIGRAAHSPKPTVRRPVGEVVGEVAGEVVV
jgi:hypothetical protein